jgi:hypothetical protein
MKVLEGSRTTVTALLFVAVLLIFASCRDDQTPEPAPDPTEQAAPEQVDPVAMFKITYGDEVTEQPSFIVGEEVVDGVDCAIIEYSYLPPASRVSPDGKTTLTLLGGKIWIAKTTREWVQAEVYNEVMDTKVTSRFTNPYRISPPLSVGKSWFYDTTATMVPEYAPPSTNRFRAEVVSQEDVTVPAGTFASYKVEFTLVAADGVEVEAPVVETAMWFAVDTYSEVKRESYTTWEQTEIAELVAAEGFDEAMNR